MFYQCQIFGPRIASGVGKSLGHCCWLLSASVASFGGNKVNNLAWGERLWNAYAQASGNKATKVRMPDPGLLNFSGEDRLVIEMTEPAATFANMQSAAGAFDAWLLVIRHHLKIDSFEIELASGHSLDSPHGGRTLFRLRKLKQLLGDELTIGPRLGAAMLAHAWGRRPESKVFLNVAGSGRDRRLAEGTRLKTESDIELALCYDPILSAALAAAFNLKRRDQAAEAQPLWALCRQFPVGVFSHDPSKPVGIDEERMSFCPGGKSAIDLVGMDKEEAFHVFEIKKPGAMAVGALSELLFYTNLIDDARNGQILFSQGTTDRHARVMRDDVEKATSVKGHLLAPDIHPLLTAGLFQDIRDLTADANWQVTLDAHRLSEKVPAIDFFWHQAA